MNNGLSKEITMEYENPASIEMEASMVVEVGGGAGTVTKEEKATWDNKASVSEDGGTLIFSTSDNKK